MIVSVASGKGGTGKTTVAVSLALAAASSRPDRVQLLDCDVEEPNCNLLLGMNLETAEEVNLGVPAIDKTKCDFCGKCADFCNYHALAVLPSDVIVFSELCHGCGGCMLLCPKGAIGEKTRTVGTIQRGRKDGLELYQGLLNIGEAVAVPVIKALKRKIDSGRLVILDSSPGAACPVVETIRGSDLCLLVTEPTPFGLHDLKIAVTVARKLNVPFGVVINRDGIGDGRVDDWCKDEKIPVLMRIPNSLEVARLYSKGIPPVLGMPDLNDRFIELLKAVEGRA